MDTEDQFRLFGLTSARIRLERNEDGQNTLVIMGSGLADAPDAWVESIDRVQFIDNAEDLEQRNIREFSFAPEISGFARTFVGRQKEIVK